MSWNEITNRFQYSMKIACPEKVWFSSYGASMTRPKMCIWLFLKIGSLVWAGNGIRWKNMFLIIVFTFNVAKASFWVIDLDLWFKIISINRIYWFFKFQYFYCLRCLLKVKNIYRLRKEWVWPTKYLLFSFFIFSFFVFCSFIVWIQWSCLFCFPIADPISIS